jgi:hypothetical protein
MHLYDVPSGSPLERGGTMQIVTDFLFSHDMLTAVTGGVITNLLISLFWALAGLRTY